MKLVLYPLTRKNTVVERKISILVLSIIVDPEIKFMSIDSYVITSNFVAIHLLYQNKENEKNVFKNLKQKLFNPLTCSP